MFAAARSDSNARAVAMGSRCSRNCCNRSHMPAFSLVPNDVGCWSERSKRNTSADASVVAALLVISSG